MNQGTQEGRGSVEALWHIAVDLPALKSQHPSAVARAQPCFSKYCAARAGRGRGQTWTKQSASSANRSGVTSLDCPHLINAAAALWWAIQAAHSSQISSWQSQECICEGLKGIGRAGYLAVLDCIIPGHHPSLKFRCQKEDGGP
jgi:hypothetical protein